MARCFVSHATRDRDFVETELLGLLESLGLDPWFAENDINASEEWERSILAGLKASDWVVVVLSPRSAESDWVKDEVHWAIDNCPGRVVPVLIENCSLEAFHIRLPRLQCVDFVKDRSAGTRALIRLFVDGVYRPLRRAQAIAGNWTGHILQEVGFECQYAATCTLSVSGDTIGGFFRFRNERDSSDFVECTVTGGSLYDRFLQLNYVANDPTRIQFGTILAEVHAEGDKLDGRFLGYGATSQQIVTGEVHLTKSD